MTAVKIHIINNKAITTKMQIYNNSIHKNLKFQKYS